MQHMKMKNTYNSLYYSFSLYAYMCVLFLKMESLYKRYVCSPIFFPLNFISGLFFMSFVIVVQSLSRV